MRPQILGGELRRSSSGEEAERSVPVVGDKEARVTLALADLETVCRMVNNRPTVKKNFIVW